MDVVQSCLIFHTFLSCFCKTRNTTACLQGTETEVQNLAVRVERLYFFFLIYFAPSLDSAGSTSSKIYVLNCTRNGVTSIMLLHVKKQLLCA